MSGKKILVVAPHPDDETLGAGGTLLKHQENGDSLFWLIMTTVSGHPSYSDHFKNLREQQINIISSLYKMQDTFQLPFHSAKLDRYSLCEIISAVNEIITKVQPNIIYQPFSYDAHSDHRITFETISACSKIFRFYSIEEVLLYETPSETDFALPTNPIFQPNVFVNISKTFNKKITILKQYNNELGEHPFPRSIEAIYALAKLRGVQSNSNFAEAFMLIKKIC